MLSEDKDNLESIIIIIVVVKENKTFIQMTKLQLAFTSLIQKASLCNWLLCKKTNMWKKKPIMKTVYFQSWRHFRCRYHLYPEDYEEHVENCCPDEIISKDYFFTV